MTRAQEVYDADVRPLPPAERLKLAAMILDDLASHSSSIDVNDAWNGEDMRDLVAFSLHAAEAGDSPKEDGFA